MGRSSSSSDEDLAFKHLEEEPVGWRKYISSNNLVLLFYVVMAILVGTANRVTFRLMQYSMMNYGYFISQITTFIYLPVNFSIVLIKLLFTNHITQEMLDFPQWKFVIMGIWDSLQGLLIVVGGLNVPGIMQNLLLQGAVPVTMLFSLLMLRYRGDDITRIARQVLKRKGIEFTESYVGDDVVRHADGASVCRILVNGSSVGNIPELLRLERPPDEDVFAAIGKWIYNKCTGCTSNNKYDSTYSVQSGSLSHVTLFSSISQEELEGQVVLESDALSWSQHLKSYYTIAQYVGATVIMAGLVTSVWNAISGKTGTGAGPIGWDIIFFSATIPIAVSAVYKEIAFKQVSDMDVWYLNGYVALPQFVIGLLYAPLAAVMTNLAVNDIPENIWNGYQCWINGVNFITRANGFDCSEELMCGESGNKMCCDSCDGSLPQVSSLAALWAVIGYMIANLSYNVFLVLVIKHGSAALMYATSTIVLPLGAIAFTIPLFMGEHAQAFDVYTGAGLGVVLFGLIIYRFADMVVGALFKKKKH